MPNVRQSLLLFGTRDPAGGAPTAVATGANAHSNPAYIGTATNVTVFVFNGDGVNSSQLTVQVAANLNGTAGRNWTPADADWYNLYDSSTGNLAQWTVAAGGRIAINIPNIAATQIRLVSATALTSCLAVAEASQ